jgi:HK97 family phage portal protein
MSTFSSLLKRIFIREPEDFIKKFNELELGAENSFNEAAAENIATVYTCAKILAEDIGSLPLNIYMNDEAGGKTILRDDYRYGLLHYGPNNYTTSQAFFSTLEYIRNIKGNSFARIYRDAKGYVSSLSIIPPSYITGYSINNNELYYKYDDGEKEAVLNASEVLHFKSISDVGVWGINPIEKLRLNLSVTHKAFTTIDNFYSNNATSPKVLETLIPEGINPREWQEKITEFNEKYVGTRNAGKIITLPPFTKLSDVTLNFADAQFISTIKFNADQISSLYKIPPHLVGNFESSKFNNLEQLQLNYKISTIRPILRMYRQEMESKLITTEERVNGVSIEFNSNALVETDSRSRMENYKTLFSVGAITPNQICKYEGYPSYGPAGDQHFVMTNLMSVEKYNDKKPQQTDSQE